MECLCWWSKALGLQLAVVIWPLTARHHCDEWLPHAEDCHARITGQNECTGQRLAVLVESSIFPRVMVVEVPILVGGGTLSFMRG